MRNISPELKAEFVAGRRNTVVKMTTIYGDVYGWTDLDEELTIDGITYIPAPGLIRTNLTSSTDESVSNQELTSGWVDAPEEELLNGRFDNAEVQVAFASPTRPDLGLFVLGKGNIGVVQWTIDGFRADVQSHMRRLAKNVNYTFTPDCPHQLFSQPSQDTIGFCGLNKASYTFTGQVQTVTEGKLKFTAIGLSQPSGYFDRGILKFTTGPNANLSVQVKTHTVGANTSFVLFLPTIVAFNVGDQFEVSAGCDGRFSTCVSKFGNGARFGGFPDIQVEVQYR